MKRFLAIFLAMLMVVSTGVTAAMADEEIHIEMIQWWAAALGDEEYRALLDEFEAQNPGIKVSDVNTPFASVREQVIAGMATGTLSDVMGVDGAWINEFVDMGILEPLDPFLEKTTMDLNDISAITSVDGSAYVIAQTTFIYPLFVNLDLFAAAGIEKMPTTRSELLEAAKALTDTSKNQYGIVIPLSLTAPNGIQNDVMSWLWNSGGTMLKDGRPDLTNPDVKETIEFIKALYDAGAMSPGAFTKTEVDKPEEFANGRAAMMVATLGNVITLRDANPDLNFTVIPMPVKDGYEGEQGITYASWGLGVNAASEHKEAAWKLIEFFMQKENNLLLANGGKGFPGLISAVPEFVSTDEIYQKGFDIFQSGYLVNEFSGLPTAEELMRLLAEQLQIALEGKQTVDEALSKAQAAWESVF